MQYTVEHLCIYGTYWTLFRFDPSMQSYESQLLAVLT